MTRPGARARGLPECEDIDVQKDEKTCDKKPGGAEQGGAALKKSPKKNRRAEKKLFLVREETSPRRGKQTEPTEFTLSYFVFPFCLVFSSAFRLFPRHLFCVSTNCNSNIQSFSLLLLLTATSGYFDFVASPRAGTEGGGVRFMEIP